jgi:DNA-binding NarL/FixJ family response regulator
MSLAISPRASIERDHVSMTRVLVLADDLIWSTRLIDQVRAAGADGAPIRTLAALNQALPAADAVVVDLTARAYDGIVAVRRAADAGRRVLAVGQHDDAALRKRALAAGADKVLAYRKLFDDGPATIASWLGLPAPAATRP